MIVLAVFRFLHQRLPTGPQRPRFWWPSVLTQLRSPLRPRTVTTSHTWWTSVTTPQSCQWPLQWEPPCSSSTFWPLPHFTTRRTRGGMMYIGAAAPSGVRPMTWHTLKRRRSCPCKWSSTLTWTGTAGGWATPCTHMTWCWGLPAHLTTLWPWGARRTTSRSWRRTR